MLRYKSDYKIKIKGYLKVFIVCFVLGLFVTKYNPILFSVVIVLIGYLFTNMLNRSVIEIILDLDRGIVCFKFSQYIFYTTRKKFKIEDYGFVFKELIGARGKKRYLFRVSKEDEKIIDISPELTGWSENILIEIVGKINNAKK